MRLKGWFGRTPGGTTTSYICMNCDIGGPVGDRLSSGGGRSRDVPRALINGDDGVGDGDDDGAGAGGIIRRFIPACTFAGHVTTVVFEVGVACKFELPFIMFKVGQKKGMRGIHHTHSCSVLRCSP
jgi:hypothetical protein